MVKYGKEFRKKQNAEWKDKYFDYKGKKQMIKKYIEEKEGYTDSDFSILSKLETWTSEFEDSLNKDIKKVYIFFSNKERTLYKKMNESLHLKKEDEILDLFGYLNVFDQLKDLSNWDSMNGDKQPVPVPDPIGEDRRRMEEQERKALEDLRNHRNGGSFEGSNGGSGGGLGSW